MFKEILKRERKLKNLSQEELAEKLQLTKSAISNYECGLRQPDNQTIIKIASFFGITVDYLLGLEDKKVFYTALPNNSPQTKKDELKQLINSANIPDDKIDILINMIESWK